MAAVVDVVEDAAKAAAEELEITKYYTDYKEVLKDDEIDAVVVVSPTNLHKDIVIDCANAGKTYFLRKTNGYGFPGMRGDGSSRKEEQCEVADWLYEAA